MQGAHAWQPGIEGQQEIEALLGSHLPHDHAAGSHSEGFFDEVAELDLARPLKPCLTGLHRNPIGMLEAQAKQLVTTYKGMRRQPMSLLNNIITATVTTTCATIALAAALVLRTPLWAAAAVLLALSAVAPIVTARKRWLASTEPATIAPDPDAVFELAFKPKAAGPVVRVDSCPVWCVGHTQHEAQDREVCHGSEGVLSPGSVNGDMLVKLQQFDGEPLVIWVEEAYLTPGAEVDALIDAIRATAAGAGVSA